MQLTSNAMRRMWREVAAVQHKLEQLEQEAYEGPSRPVSVYQLTRTLAVDHAVTLNNQGVLTID